jgi:hypothetical protein
VTRYRFGKYFLSAPQVFNISPTDFSLVDIGTSDIIAPNFRAILSAHQNQFFTLICELKVEAMPKLLKSGDFYDGKS